MYEVCLFCLSMGMLSFRMVYLATISDLSRLISSTFMIIHIDLKGWALDGIGLKIFFI